MPFSVLEVIVAPPMCYLSQVCDAIHPSIGVAAQNCYKCDSGAFTGEIRYHDQTY